MAKIRKSQPLVPSVLDRLMTRSGSRAVGGNGPPEHLLRDLKRCVRRDLEHLLNTRHRWVGVPEELGTLDELPRSVVDYGTADFTGAHLNTPERQDEFCRSLERSIRAFEPRFKRVKVSLERNTDPVDRTLRFKIDALLEADPAPVQVVFDSVMEPITGSFKVEGGETR